MSERPAAAPVNFPRRLVCEWQPAGYYTIEAGHELGVYSDPGEVAFVVNRLADPRLIGPAGGKC